MRALLCLLAVSAAAYASVVPGSVEINPVRTHPKPSAAAPAPAYQIIVKLRSAPVASVSGQEQALSLSAHDRIANVAGRSGITLRDAHEIIDRMHVLQVEPALSGESLEATVARVKADADVEYAVPDERRYPHAIPSDSLYATGQWYEQVNAQTPAAVDAQSAWDVTKGDPSLVIADLDTGVRFDHPDLLKAANSGRLLPGYDFISNAAVANDGDGRDADASDPGDWISQADTQNTQFKTSCPTPQISTWHGTRTAGILGALSNNAHGIAGMTWQGKILPVRVLGKCGGYDSDIIAAMMWAAGEAVSGVPVNQNPARIINMSLGSSATCPQSYADVISQLAAMGVLVVVSAGNDGKPVDAPANCPGAVAVAGIRHAGTKVGYSNLGPEVAVSAPAGNCGVSGTTCVYQIQTTTNSGTQGPTANDDAYTDATIVTDTTPKGPNLGTSFSAPIVSGIAALMASANSNLTTCQLTSRLKEGSVPFPQTSVTSSTMCHVPTGASDIQNAECICTLDGKTCGVGMANAKGAVQAALRPIAAVSLPATVTAGQAVALNASVSAAANGHTISSYQWSSIGKQTVAIQNATSGTATVTAPTCGLATLQVVVTDDAGLTDTATVVLDSSSVTSIAPSNATNKSCFTTTPSVKLEVCPASTSVQTNATQAFTDTVANTTDDSVTWEVEGVAGGNPTVGTISSTGIYTAPTTPPSGSQVSITAISNADQTVSASATLNVTTPPASHGGGGAVDPLTLLGEALALGSAVAARRRRA